MERDVFDILLACNREREQNILTHRLLLAPELDATWVIIRLASSPERFRGSEKLVVTL